MSTEKLHWDNIVEYASPVKAIGIGNWSLEKFLRIKPFALWQLVFCLFVAALSAQAQPNPTTGQQTFESQCSGCHGADGNGGELGPAIAARADHLTDDQIKNTVLHGVAGRMPAIPLKDTEITPLIEFLRTLKSEQTGFQSYPIEAHLTNGKTLKGMVIGESFDDMQIGGDDKQIHLLRRAEGNQFREVTSEVNWTTYNGDPGGNRYTKLTQINKENVKRVAPRWIFSMPDVFPLEGTPIVADGVMYVTSANECYALDAGSGRQIWHYHRNRTAGLSGIAAAGMNRGIAISGARIFMGTDNAHLIALNKLDGELLWETTVADWHKNYNITSAPLAVDNLVVTGTSGGEDGARGFIAAYDQETGKEAWRFWTVPTPGEPGSETWKGPGIEHGGAPAWFTGVYDAETDTFIWPTGNPSAEYNGDDRAGDNLYSDCLLALDAKTGKLKWHFQTTPHDLWDWDATETPLIVDATWQGQPRKLVVQGNRNGFFYVLDRTDGKLFFAKQFISELNWASGIDANGRPIKIAGHEPSETGTRVCPSQDGATNWYAPSYSPITGLFYMQTNEKCSVYIKRPDVYREGREYLGGTQREDLSKKPQRILRALDLQTGAIKWQVPQVGNADTWGGTLATASGLVFFAEDSGDFAAADAETGKTLWTFPANTSWKASPMAYQFDSKEMIGIALGTSIMAFGLAGE